MSDYELADVARLRQALYRFCAGALLPPDRARMQAVRGAAGVIDAHDVDAFAFAPAWHAVRTELRRLPTLEALAGEYVRLFRSASGRALCPPLESFYLGSSRHAGAATTALTVEADYQRHGLRFAPGQAHAADEAAPQLELLAHMCGAEATARERDDHAGAAAVVAEEAAFLDGHLARWFPSFAARVHKAAPPGFYATLVAFAETFIGHDRELASNLAAERRPT